MATTKTKNFRMPSCSICFGNLLNDHGIYEANQNGEGQQQQQPEIVAIIDCGHVFHKRCLTEVVLIN